MAALWNRAGHYIFALWFLLLSIFFLSFFPRLISAVANCPLHTHGVAIVRSEAAGLKRASRGSLKIQDAENDKNSPPAHFFYRFRPVAAL